MRTSFRLIVSALAVTAALLTTASVGVCSPQSAGKVDDHSLQQQIAHRFETSPSLKSHDLEVAVENGVATLTGVVPTSALKARAGQLARVTGVSRVDNRIEIDAASANRSKIDAAGEKTKEGVDKGVDATVKAAQKTKEAVEKGLGKSEEGAGKAANKTSEGFAKTGEKLTDTAIATRVKAGFSGDDTVRGSAIEVDVADQVVTLRGTVPSAVARERAVAIAKGVDGVRRVVDNLTVSKSD